MDTNVLYYGDNLEILRGEYIPTESVDLIYIDPPFNSNRIYKTFDDTWHWTDQNF